MLRISIPFFFLCHPTLPTHLFLPLTPAPHPPPPPFLDITECRSENKKTSRASGTKVHIHIINLRFVKKTIETRKKNKPTRFFVFFSVCLRPPIRPSSCYHLPFRAILGGDLKCDLTFDEQEYDLFFIILKDAYKIGRAHV